MRYIVLIILIFVAVFSVNAAPIKAGELNTAYVLMFHPEMRDYITMYGRFTINEYQFEGSEADRIKQRNERIQEKKEKKEQVSENIKKLDRDYKRKRDELSEITGQKNKELFEINARYRAEMKGLDVNQVSQKEKEREAEYKKIVEKYNSRIDTLMKEIDSIKDDMENDSDLIRAKKAADMLNGDEIFLNARDSRAKAQKILDTINAAIEKVSKKNNMDIVFNRALYSPLGKIKNMLTFEKVFQDEEVIDDGNTFEDIPVEASETDKPQDALHNLLDSDKEEDIYKFYGLRFQELDNFVRPFYPVLIGNTIVYGDNIRISKNITKEVVNELFSVYKVRDFEQEISNKILDKLLD